MNFRIKGILMCASLLCLYTGTTVSEFKLGVENISQTLINDLCTQRIGLITNQTGRNQKGIKTLDILRHQGITVNALLAPEHGINGTTEASQEVFNSKSNEYPLPVISLYGKGTGKNFSPDMLKEIDTLIFDIQDSGMRHYTYISTLFYAIKASVEHHKSLIVLDRPNPLGRVAEGPLVDAHIKSFIAIAPIPLRHGMTVGELARYFNTQHFDGKANLCVVPMSGYYDAKQLMQQCAMNLSPNIQSLDACYGYSFLGLLGEIRPFDVGIGTSFAFQCITLPQDLKTSSNFWTLLRSQLAKHGINSAHFTYYSMRKKKKMIGIRVTIPSIHAVSTCNILSTIITSARRHGLSLTFSPEFDTAIGSHLARKAFDNIQAWNNFMTTTTEQIKTFCHNARSSYLYKPIPTTLKTMPK